MWLTNSIVVLEFAASLKFGVDVFIEPFPLPVIVAWILVGIVFFGILIYLMIKDLQKKPNKANDTIEFNPYNPAIDIEYVR